MNLCVQTTPCLRGTVNVPASKSHTIRAVIIASLAHGVSRIHRPLFSEDTKAAMQACEALGARIERSDNMLVVHGWGGCPRSPQRALDMFNSGTSANLMLGVLAACGVPAEITGDASLRSRPVGALVKAFRALGAAVEFLGSDGCPPLRVSGRMRGGAVTLDAGKSSQYVSSMLIACPLLERDTELLVTNPSELPYIEMTLQWLRQQGIRFERDGFHRFMIVGNQTYAPFEKTIPADWSSAAFPLCAAALTDSDVVVSGVEQADVQGDKAIVDYLRQMGACIREVPGGIRITGVPLEGRELDINSTPDALPALAVVGCFASGTTRLYNVAQARVKETDRIAVMAAELRKMNARISELPDGLLIQNSKLRGAAVHGHHDHRVVMALSLAGMIASGKTTVDTAEAVSVTYPDYVDAMGRLGAEIQFDSGGYKLC